MGLSEIAEGLETTTEQRDRGVATVDATERSLAARLADVEGDLPCGAAAAARIVDAFAGGSSVGEAADAGRVAPMTAAKALHRVGVEGVSPLSPVGREVLRDWLTADLTRSEALALADASEAEFALATYVETHDPIPGAREAVESVLAPGGDALVRKRNRLADALQGSG